MVGRVIWRKPPKSLPRWFAARPRKYRSWTHCLPGAHTTPIGARMRYVSTRGAAPALGFEDVLTAGLAPDGGLYVPEAWPCFTPEDIAALAGLSYADTAAAVMAPFVGGALDAGELRAVCARAYARFEHADVTPLVPLASGEWLLDLSGGPTLAFKDVAMQLLGLLFERFLPGSGRTLTVVGATSGDTGSAAIEALAGRARVEVFVLFPEGRVTEVQRRQMTTVAAENVHAVAVRGDFDTCQALVKRMLGDEALGARLRLGAVNSINWARLMAQVVYYFHAAVRLGAPERRVAFSVPTGNFGDVFAGWVAARMGLPVARLIVATNVNDILARALQTGDYACGPVVPTATPSMDIQVASNFERLLWDAGGQDGAAVAAQMHGFDEMRVLRLTERQRAEAGALLVGERVDWAEALAAMRWAHEEAGIVIDPHTAVALAASCRHEGDVPMVTLATAHPAKFPDAVEEATGVRPVLPPRLADLLSRAEHQDVLDADYKAVSGYVAARAGD